MKQHIQSVEFPTKQRGLYDITHHVAEVIAKARITTGLATIHIQHTSASLLIQENADPTVRADLERFFKRLVPDGDRLFQHNAEGDDDMPAHIRTVLTCVNFSVPIANGVMTLGTWQGIYLWEHRTHPHQRLVTVHVMGE
ncbi:MAG: secondary thiamine-phosphate synthase enzyme YjbQ [Verrucomicrobiales bacterium]